VLTNIELTNFRGFKSFHAPVGPVTAIAGRNSSGKTSLLQAVRLACDALALALEEDDLLPKVEGSSAIYHNVIVRDPSRLSSLADWRQLFADGEVGEGTSLEVKLGFRADAPLQRLSATLSYARNAQLKMSLALDSDPAVSTAARAKPRQRPAALRNALEAIRPRAFFVPAFYGVTRTEEYRTRPLLDRSLGSGDQSRIVRNLIARLDLAGVERMNAFLARSLGARVERRTSQQDAERVAELVVTYRDTNGELELSSAGTGLVALVALYAAMESVRSQGLREGDRSVLFLLDEPEAHLHPRLQGDVGEELAKLAGEFGLQLVLATHSIEMINRLGRRRDVILLSVDRHASAAVELRGESDVISALDEFCDLTPFTSLSFMASRKVLFHEGPTDLRLLGACARLYFRSDDQRMARWRQYTAVPLEGVGNRSAAGLLKAVLSPRLFPKLASAPRVQVALVLDRDFDRDPKLEKRQQGSIDVIECIWSRHSIESLFLEPSLLAGWLESLVGLPLDELRGYVEQALAEADKDQALLDDAEDGRRRVHRRAVEGKAFVEDKAVKAARQDARSSPAIWQPGKKRASYVLDKIRKALPSTKARALSGSLIDLIERAAVDTLGDPERLIPQEIRDLLDRLVAT
jgi:putative AbiEii toxin of type IV toxin-antitoxin system